MKLKKKMWAIAAGLSLEQLKHHAETTTKKHEQALSEADDHAHKAAIKFGHKPKGNENERRQYEDYKGHYLQHELYHKHPELHATLQRLNKEAPQARLAYKRAARTQ